MVGWKEDLSLSLIFFLFLERTKENKNILFYIVMWFVLSVGVFKTNLK